MSPERILIVDDEEDIREVATAALEAVGGYDVIAAGSGESGIARAAAERPDVILLDVMMPLLDGPATFAKLREREETSGIPVIFMTARVQPADRRRIEALGAIGVIAKPFDPMTISAQVAELFQEASK